MQKLLRSSAHLIAEDYKRLKLSSKGKLFDAELQADVDNVSGWRKEVQSFVSLRKCQLLTINVTSSITSWLKKHLMLSLKLETLRSPSTSIRVIDNL